MNQTLTRLALASVTALTALTLAAPSQAQVAGGTTTVGVSITESTQMAAGWSVKKTLMGKTIYNETGQKVGKVEDLIISPDKNVSYVIVGAGGFVGIGRHDVAIPVSQIQDKAGKLVMAGATQDMVKAMPEFSYATDSTRRDAFVAAADKDIARGKVAVARLEKQSGAAATEAKVTIEREPSQLRVDLTAAQTKLSEMKTATAARWKDFEADVSAATARLRKSTDKAAG